MADPRTNSKIFPPDLSRIISRSRLIQRVSAAGAVPVILITGQAAQGKTTLAAEIVRLDGPVGAWMHLDPSDTDPVNFFHLLIHAINAAQPGLDVSPFLKNPAISFGPEPSPARIAERVGVFLQTVIAKAPVRLVIDGLDDLFSNPDSLAVIDIMRKVIFPPSRLLMVSREIPPLTLDALQMRHELLVLDNDDLAFTTNEIFRFFLDLHGLHLAPPELTRIHEITDGWAGGLVLVWEALSHVPEDQRIGFINNGLPTAMQGKRSAYFSEAFFSGLDASLRHFLIRSAIFDTINAKLIACYLGDTTEEEIDCLLADLVRRNLFIHPFFDPSTGWGYRYNQPFRDFLLDKFQNSLDKPEQRVLLIRAADLIWDEGNFEGAIRLFLQAQSFAKAAAGIKKIAMGLSARGRFTDLAGWIDMLPDSIFQDDAWLSFYRAAGDRISGGRRNITAFSKLFNRFAAEGDQRGQLMALAYLIETAIFISHPAGDLKRWLESAWRLLERVSGNEYYPFAKAVLWMQVAFGYISGAGDLQKGLSACRNAMLLAGNIRDDILTVNATIIHVFGLSLSGEFSAAEKALATIQDLVAAAYPEYRALRNIVCMKLALSQGDLELAQRLLDANQGDIDRFGLLFLYPIHVDLTGLLQIQQRRYEALGRTACHLSDVATLTANPFYSGLALRLRALNDYHQARYERAHAWAEQAIAVITRSLGDESIHLYRCDLILGMVAYHLNDLASARQLLTAACEFFDRVSSHLSLVEARLGLALVATTMGNRAAAEHHRKSALMMAVSKGYEAFPILSASDIVAACKPALEHSRRDVSLFVQRILNHLPVDILSAAAEEPSHAFPASARDESEGIRYRFDIRTLGGFEVRRENGARINDAEWTGIRQQLLLKAIVVNGCREIPKDILMDALWPESKYDAALKRFKVTLHRLRRILEPDTDQRYGASCIILKDNRISLDMRRCRVDVNDFLAACNLVRQLGGDDDDQRRLSACRRAIDIYRGEFLPEELYLGWAEMKRAALKDQYLTVLEEIVEILERSGDLSQAVRYCEAVIQADPLAEQAAQRLMHLLLRQGRSSAALQVYRNLTQALASELDTGPDSSTIRIYGEILNR